MTGSNVSVFLEKFISSFEESRMQESNNPRKAVIYTLFMQGNDMIYSSSLS